MPAISLTIENSSLPEPEFEDLSREVFDRLVQLTPVDTGFCADSWEYDFQGDSCTFYNPCDYASYLDDGWSNQAPDGMTRPVLQELPALVRGYR